MFFLQCLHVDPPWKLPSLLYFDMKTKEWQDKWLEFASWPCNSRVERAGRWAHRWGRAPELVLAKLMQDTYMHFCCLAACQSRERIGPFGRCDTKQSQKQTFVGHIFACSFCSACVFTLNGSYLLSGTITWRPRSDRTNDSSLSPGHATQELRGLRCCFFSSSCKAYQERKGRTIEISLDLQDKNTEGNPKNEIFRFFWVGWCVNTLDHWAPTPTCLGQCSPFKRIIRDIQTNCGRPPCGNCRLRKRPSQSSWTAWASTYQ